MVDSAELKALCERIIKSGELGRSRTYAAILEYLVEHAIAGTTPKEISIAMDVLGRESDFDVGKDSIVRVHIYHLRSKLNSYFARQGEQEKFRIEIPKGQYMLAVTENLQAEPAAPAEATPAVSIGGQPQTRRNYTPYLAAVAIGLLLLNLVMPRDGANSGAANAFAETRLWQPLLDDALPVLVLIGDYYIMGEVDERGNIERMVREFDVNSNAQLMAMQTQGGMMEYRNLDLAYVPTSASKALLSIMQVFANQSDRVQVKMMSELSTNDLVGRHIIYLGYLSGLQNLTDLMFAASGLAIGLTYDELLNLDTDAVYTSSSGLSVGEASYRDYGMLSTFPAPSGTQFLLMAGMRDEGLINLAEEVTDLPSLKTLGDSVTGEQEGEQAFEALYEVRGFDNTNFDANLVYSNILDTEVLWETRLIGEPQR